MRTREEQIEDLANEVAAIVCTDAEGIALAQKHIKEAEHRAEQRVRAEIGRALDKACETVMWIETPAMEGDNLAVTLCSHFEDCEGEADDCGWHPKAVEGYEQVKGAIAQHFRSAIDAAREAG